MEQGEVGYKSCLAKPNPDYLGLRIHAPQDLSDEARCLCDPHEPRRHFEFRENFRR